MLSVVLRSNPGSYQQMQPIICSLVWRRGEELAPGEFWITSESFLCKCAPSSLSAWTSVSLWKHRHWGRYKHCFPSPPPGVWTISSANSGSTTERGHLGEDPDSSSWSSMILVLWTSDQEIFGYREPSYIHSGSTLTSTHYTSTTHTYTNYIS